MEPDDGLEKMRLALKICAHFKSLYFEKRGQLSSYFKEQPVVEWNFKSSLIFTRMDVFINQMKLIEVIQFSHCPHVYAIMSNDNNFAMNL